MRSYCTGRNEGRSRDALAAAAGAGGVVSGDLSTIAGARTVADEVNKVGRFDAVIHNAGVGYRERRVFLSSTPSCAEPDRGRPQDSGGVADRVRPHLRHSSRLTGRRMAPRLAN